MFGPLFDTLYTEQPVSGSVAPAAFVPITSPPSKLDGFLNKVKTFDPFPMLYSRTSTGAVQTWKVEVEGNKYRYHTGQKGGAIIVSDWTVCQGKNSGRANETTGEMQAQKEAKAAMAKKLKSGGYWENEADIDKIRFFEPMLAYKLVDYTDSVSYPTMVDRKYNGGRVVGNREGLKTRKGETYQTIPHIWEAIKSLFTQFPDLVLDGEGYNHELRFKLNQLMSILNTKKSTKINADFLKRSEAIVRYYVYDGHGFTINGVEITKETPCRERRDALAIFLKDVSYIEVVPYEMAASEDEVMKKYEGYVYDGYEGAIIRNPSAEYQNKRTKDLLKVKPLDDAEFTIVGVEDGVGNWANKAKRIWFMDQKGNRFKGSFKGSMEEATKFLQEKNKWIGQTVTVHYNGLTEYGVPNYAQLDINNCIKLDR